MIWHRRAALNTPWNPWGDELFRIDGDHVQLYDATHIANAVLQSKLDVANRTPAQATPANMPVWTQNHAGFRGHGTITATGNQALRTGLWAPWSSCPFTIYVVTQIPTPHTTLNIELFDSPTIIRHLVYYTSAGRLGIYNGTACDIGAYSPGTLIVGAFVFNGVSTQVFINSTAPIVTVSAGTNSLIGLTIGNAATGSNYAWTAPIAHVSAFAGLQSSRTSRYLGDQYGATIT